MAVQTTWELAKQQLTEAVEADADLSDVMKVALEARVDALPRTQLLKLSAANVLSSTDVTVSEANDAITVADGDTGFVIFNLETFDTPVRIDGTFGPGGALVGHVGQGSNARVADADITLSYRLASSGTFKAFRRNTVLDAVDTIQFRVDVATQTGNHDLPQLYLVAEQL